MFGNTKQQRKFCFSLIQGSLNPSSSVALLLDEVACACNQRGVDVTLVDVRTNHIDLFSDKTIEEYNASTQELYRTLQGADGYIFGMPVYAQTVTGELKNIISLCGDVIAGKPNGIVCASNGVPTYPSAVQLIHLLSGVSSVTVQPVIHATPECFRQGAIFDEEIPILIREMVDAILKRCFLKVLK